MSNECKFCIDEVCVNADCPLRADFCPVVNTPDVCKYEQRGNTNNKSIIPCSKCFNACLDDELTDDNDFSSSTIEYNKHDNFRMMLSSGAGKPLRIEAEQWSPSAKQWITVGQYYPKFCPECGRKITEYENIKY